MKVPQEATREPAARRKTEAVRQDATQQPAGTNEEGGSRMDARGGCATKGDARWRRATRGDTITSQQTEANGKKCASGQEAAGR